MLQFILPLAPSVNRLWRISGKRMYKSQEYKNWIEEAGWMLKEQIKTKIDGKYAIHIAVLRADKRRRDLDNLLKATSDLLVAMQIVEDDSQCMALAAEWSEDLVAPMIVTLIEVEGKNPNVHGTESRVLQ
jgi:Holliday junction resolvase RusA-like endonuclease